MTTGLVYDEAFLLHRPPYEHPEHPGRLSAIWSRLTDDGLAGRCRRVDAREATREELLAVHTPGHIDRIEATAKRDFGELDPDTYTSRHSAAVARLAAGSLVDLVGQVLSGAFANGFALLRPPGHHAEADRAMGFCLFNNVAVAAQAALGRVAQAALGRVAQAAPLGRVAQAAPLGRVAGAAARGRVTQAAALGRVAQAAGLRSAGIRRIAIVDWDLHHGNGTQHSFEEDADVLYFSAHQYPFYPGTGAIREVGRGQGRGRTVNVAWPAGMGDAEYLAAFDRVLLPIAREFGPELVLVSCGFDAAAGDPLGGMRLSAAGHAAMTQRVCSLAGGRVVLALEGGYDLDAISAAAATCTSVLLGDTAPQIDPGPPNAVAERVLSEVIETHRPFWQL
ncbi:MAG TPA: histone deacetylase [Thermoanaerobaculia bacterium]|nr:histone deacetylase [Thermoanaerobaculia bacterium]